MNSGRTEWSIVAVGLGLALLAWFTRGTPSIGGRVAYVFTVIPADESGTACASDQSIDTYHCEFDQADRRVDSPNLLRPFVTLTGEQVLLAGVFDGQEIAEWLSVSRQTGNAERIRVRCVGRLLGVVREARVRWTTASSWGSAGGLSAAAIDGCSVAK